MTLTLIAAYLTMFVAWVRIDHTLARYIQRLLESEALTVPQRKKDEKSMDNAFVARICLAALVVIVIVSLPYIVKPL